MSRQGERAEGAGQREGESAKWLVKKTKMGSQGHWGSYGTWKSLKRSQEERPTFHK